MQPQKLEVVIIRWFDSFFVKGDIKADEVDPAIELTACGMLVKEDDDRVTIALDLDPASSEFRYVLTIPKVNIRAMKKYQLTVPIVK